MVPELVTTKFEPMEKTPNPPRPVVVMVPELVMVALGPRERIPNAVVPLVVMVPDLVLVMVALAPKDWIALPLVAMHPLLVKVSLVTVDV
jgi:hypothetical protein